MSGDSWETPEEAFQFLDDHILLSRRQKRIWDPFYCTGRSKTCLQNVFPTKFVISENEDFFEWTPPLGFDVIISNPPYSIMKKVIFRLITLQKPFALFIRADFIFTAYLQEILANNIEMAVLIPRKRTSFIDPSTNSAVKGTRFHTHWLLYKIPLKHHLPESRRRTTHVQFNL